MYTDRFKVEHGVMRNAMYWFPEDVEAEKKKIENKTSNLSARQRRIITSI